MRTDLAYDCIKGDKVTGKYFGIEFTGTVIHTRYHTMNHYIKLVYVKLENPITVFGSERTHIFLEYSSKDQYANDNCIYKLERE